MTNVDHDLTGNDLCDDSSDVSDQRLEVLLAHGSLPFDCTVMCRASAFDGAIPRDLSKLVATAGCESVETLRHHLMQLRSSQSKTSPR